MLATAWSNVKAFGGRPSELLSISDPLEAYAVDSAVSRWGLAFDAALADAAADAKDAAGVERAQQKVLRRWLPSQRRYASPN